MGLSRVSSTLPEQQQPLETGGSFCRRDLVRHSSLSFARTVHAGNLTGFSAWSPSCPVSALVGLHEENGSESCYGLCDLQ